MSLASQLSLAALATLPLVGCADASTVHAAYAPGWTRPSRGSISVLGLYRDGRMDADSWDGMEPYAARALGSSACPRPLDDAWTGSRVEGISDGWLATVAPLATGDYVLVIAEQRQTTGTTASSGSGSSTSSGSGGSGLGKGKAVLLLIPLLPVLAAVLIADELAKEKEKSQKNAIDFVGVLFSRSAAKTVVAIHSHVTGMPEADARRDFAETLGRSFPGLQCGGWKGVPAAPVPAAAPSYSPF
jgi:hypothetical protein